MLELPYRTRECEIAMIMYRRALKYYVVAGLVVVTLGSSGCTDLKEDLPPSSAGLVVHDAGWNDTSAANFHGRFLRAKQWDVADCATCHAQSFEGGTSSISCFTCHESFPHSARFVQATGGHPGYLRTQMYPLDQCRTCHGGSYTGSMRVDVSCSTSGCHFDASGTPKSPESCNTCHGDFRAPADDSLSYAPPKSVVGDTSSTVRGVGAHQIHLLGAGAVSNAALACSECHTVPTAVYVSGHIDSPSPAEVFIRAALAVADTTGVSPTPSFGPQSLTCANTYCHGNWSLPKSSSQFQGLYTDSVMSGLNYAPLWTGDSSEVACGTCHGLPPAGHVTFQLSECGACHNMIVNSAGNIVDRVNHINGKIDLFGSQSDFR
jgi:hypothetical protein